MPVTGTHTISPYQKSLNTPKVSLVKNFSLQILPFLMYLLFCLFLLGIHLRFLLLASFHDPCHNGIEQIHNHKTWINLYVLPFEVADVHYSLSLQFYDLLPERYFDTSQDGAFYSMTVLAVSDYSARIMNKIREIGYVGRYQVAVDHRAIEHDGQRP